MLSPILFKPVAPALFWSFITISLYFITKNLYRRWSFFGLMPLILTPVIIAGLILLLHVSYQDYAHGTQWLAQIIGPITVAFAIPIYEKHALIRQHWLVLLVGVLVGSFTAILSSWSLAILVGLDENIRLSLLPRSISTPFALEVSHNIGGLPELTAIFVAITGILGAIMGESILKRFSFHSTLARGALLGAGAHAAGTAQAHKIGHDEGAIASLVMILSGLLNVLLLPMMSHLLK
ncbi:LrgB family protein [Legionella resiliens]|uniref:LrgB family protein n=2 Tax=Legionella TaxID=445 RepID=A0ABS8WZW2_9GAMM|nr:LrgB family protein [Legionella sp. PC1000]MCE0722883.1 LrgB family protein [Legionella sp. 9fVS26]MCE3532036.1 LrgB family protein [Legionella sp. 8cVS16]QLZ68155.1 LrgB family protein [Legionella sp. PC1000]